LEGVVIHHVAVGMKVILDMKNACGVDSFSEDGKCK